MQKIIFFIFLLVSIVSMDTSISAQPTDSSSAARAQACTTSQLAQDKVIFINKRLHVRDENCTYQPFETKGFTYAALMHGTFPDSSGRLAYYDLKNGSSTATHKTNFEFAKGFIFDRDFPRIAATGANTIRTYVKVNRELLAKAKENGLMVHAGYWVSDRDWTFAGPTGPQDRQKLIDDFVDYIDFLRADPNYGSVLAISLGTEVDISLCQFGSNCYGTTRDEQARGFYAFAQEAFTQAKASHPTSRPMMLINALFGCDAHQTFQTDIAKSSVSADDNSLSAMDAWGLDIFRGPNFNDYFCAGETVFSLYDALPTDKPLLIGEYGTDAYDNEAAAMDEQKQAQWLGGLYDLIKAEYDNPSSPVFGGHVTTWTDNAWSSGQGYTSSVWIADAENNFQAGCIGNLCDHELYGVNEVVVREISINPVQPEEAFRKQKLKPRPAVSTLTGKWK